MERNIQLILDELSTKQQAIDKEYERQNSNLSADFIQLLLSEMQRQGLDELMLHQMTPTGAMFESWEDDGEFSCDDIESVDYQIQEISFGTPSNSGDTITYKILSRFGIRDGQLVFHHTNYSSTNMGDLDFGDIAKENWQDDWLPISEFGQDRKLQNLIIKCLNTPEIWEFTKSSPECHFLHRELTESDILGKIECCNEEEKFSGAFEKWTKLEHVDLSKLDTSNAESVQAMFYHCVHLKDVDVKSLDTRNCQNFESMFDGCKELAAIEFGGKFTTAKAQTIREMFRDCESLTSLDLSSFQTKECEQMEMMFMGCSSLKSIDLQSFDGRNVVSLESMFKGCENLTDVNIKNIGITAVKNISGMFEGCSHLEEIDLEGLSTSYACNVANMFDGCSKLTRISFKKNNIRPYCAERMFGNCKSIKVLDLSSINTSNLQDIDGIFSGCESLEVLDISNWSLVSVYTCDDMFEGCTNLRKILLKNSNDKTIDCIRWQIKKAKLTDVEIITE